MKHVIVSVFGLMASGKAYTSGQLKHRCRELTDSQRNAFLDAMVEAGYLYHYPMGDRKDRYTLAINGYRWLNDALHSDEVAS